MSQERPPELVYCHCAFARVVPDEVKREVLHRLGESGRSFRAVPDLCEMAAKEDAALRELAEGGPLRVAACYPRAVRWLFHAAGAPADRLRVFNMREQAPSDIVAGMLGGATEDEA